jgi:hypothetical protein
VDAEQLVVGHSKQVVKQSYVIFPEMRRRLVVIPHKASLAAMAVDV